MLIWGMQSFYYFTTFTKQMWHMYRYVLKNPFRKDIFKQTYQNVVFREYFLTLASCIYCTYASLDTGAIKFIKLIIV